MCGVKHPLASPDVFMPSRRSFHKWKGRGGIPAALLLNTMLDNGHGLSVREVLRQLHVDHTKGLTDVQVAERRAKYGPNGNMLVCV